MNAHSSAEQQLSAPGHGELAQNYVARQSISRIRQADPPFTAPFDPIDFCQDLRGKMPEVKSDIGPEVEKRPHAMAPAGTNRA